MTKIASPELTRKMAAMPVSAVKMATTAEPPAVIKAMPKSSDTMDDTPELPHVMETKPLIPVIMSVTCEGFEAFSSHLRLASSLANLPMRAVRAAGI